MPLIELWERNADIVLKYSIKQIVSAAGDGVLTDNSECSRELRHYLRSVPAEKLFEHAEYCLSASFDRSGCALQDIVNELGRRLDYEVVDGLYQGRTNRIGFDGIWRAPDGSSIVIEIKTSDAYRMNLDSIAAYRTKLIAAGDISNNSSMLIVVGRSDTGDLEAQIRGSRHAWDIRVISLDALVKLVKLKIKSDDEVTIEKIRGLLVPFEYTRLDNIIDVVFTTTQDVEAGIEEGDESEDESDEGDDQQTVQQHTPRLVLDSVRASALAALGKRERVTLIAHKRAQYWDASKSVRAVCPVSKKYRRGYYWYGFHRHQLEFIQGGDRGFLLLGCVGLPKAYALPVGMLKENLQWLNKTESSNRMYWHIHLMPDDRERSHVLLPRKSDKLDVEQFGLPLT